MAVHSSRRVDAEQRFRELMEQFDAPYDTASELAKLRDSVNMYEARYGMPSERIHDAIDAGELIEDRDVGHWIFKYELLRSVEEK